MTRKLKSIGLALVAALALTAVAASAAQAQYTSSAENTEHQGSQITAHTFTAGAGVAAITCGTITIAGINKGTFNSGSGTYETQGIAVKPAYGTCKNALGRIVHVVKNTLDCHFLSGL